MLNTSDWHFGIVDSEALSCNFEVSSDRYDTESSIHKGYNKS